MKTYHLRTELERTADRGYGPAGPYGAGGQYGAGGPDPPGPGYGPSGPGYGAGYGPGPTGQAYVPPPETERTCSQCGRNLNPNDRFCAACGTPAPKE